MTELSASAACTALRPGWVPGTPASALDEALVLFSSLPSVGLIVATMLALRFRSSWGGLAVTVGWSAMSGLLVFRTPTGARAEAIAEGCIGSPALFIGVVTAICAATILYTAPNERRSKP